MLALAHVGTYVVESAIGSLEKMIVVTCKTNDFGKSWSAI